MSTGGLTVFDGTELRSIVLPSSELKDAVTGAQLVQIAETKVSETLSGLSLPQHIKTAALSRLSAGDDASFLRTEFVSEQASETLRDYITAIADALKDDPLVVSILDGSTLRLFLEDEDDFAMLAENLFTELDAEDKGKIPKSEIRNALAHMGVDMGMPPLSELPELEGIFKKYGAEEEKELGQAQFAELLQHVLQDVADNLHEKPAVVVQKIKVVTGSNIRKLLADANEVNSMAEKISQEQISGNDEGQKTDLIRGFLEENGREFGLPPFSEENEPLVLLYDTVFSEIENEKGSAESGFRETLKKTLEKFAEQLETTPMFCDLEQ